jgi:hypothetical protein
MCKLQVAISIPDTGQRDFETETWDPVRGRSGGLHSDQIPQAAAVNCPEEDVRIKVSLARLRKPLVVAQELARRFDEIIIQVTPHLHRGRQGPLFLRKFDQHFDRSVFFGLKTKPKRLQYVRVASLKCSSNGILYSLSKWYSPGCRLFFS